MKKDMTSEKIRKTIAADKAEAGKFGIRGTPGFLVNGVTLTGAKPISAFERVFEKRPTYIARGTTSK